MGKKCGDFIGDLGDYLDGEVAPELCEEIEKHIGQCENCRIMVDTLKQTVSLCREGRREQLPPKLQAQLTDLLRDHWRRKFGR